MKKKVIVSILILFILTPLLFSDISTISNPDEALKIIGNIPFFWFKLLINYVELIGKSIGGALTRNDNVSSQSTSESDKKTPESSSPLIGKSLELDVQLHDKDTTSSWFKGQNSLPYCNLVVPFTITNVGDKVAESVEVSIYVNEDIYSKFQSNIAPNSGYSDSIKISVEFDQLLEIEIIASLNEDKTYDYSIISVMLPRYMPLNIARLYITPEDPVIKELRNQIVEYQLIHWKALRDWVGRNIIYQPTEELDLNIFGQNDWWQLPRECASRRIGDCEDQAIILCSLLRADGWDPDEVYVIIGGEGGLTTHAWVSLKIANMGDNPIWINLEPTDGYWGIREFSDFSSLIMEIQGITERVYAFNDVYFYEY